jgi:hypothetical protein
LFGTKLELAVIIGAEMRPTGTPKHFKKGVIRNLTKQEFKRSFHVKEARWKPINEKTGCGKGITPETKRDRSMS